MDYSIGSLSDLITGSNTPNKKSVVRKKLSAKKNCSESELFNSESVEKEAHVFESAEIQEGTKKKKKKHKAINNIEEKLVPKIKKRKSQVENEEEATVKKSKNDENAERRIKLKEKAENKEEEDPEVLARTVFVGNLPITSNTKQFKRLFSKYGKVESVRIRGVPVANPKTPKKVAIIKKEFHPDRKSFYGYVRYETRDDAIKAVEANGMVYQEHHLRVHLCDGQEKPDENKAIFVGNLSFYAEEDDLWKLFECCGAIESVRIVRDGRTGIGKGFGYVNFKNSDSVTLALEMENVKVKDRELRISLCNINTAKKNKKKDKMKKVKKAGGQKHEKSETEGAKVKQEDEHKNKTFHGVKFVEKKKKKFNKGLLQKKKIIKQIAPK